MQGLETRGFKFRCWFLWLRHSYRFRWAHRPLCERFHAGVLRIGPVHLCRSCICVYGGLIGFAVLCACVGALRVSVTSWLLGLMVPTVILSMPLLYRRLPRPLKDVLRFGMGACISLCGYAMLRGNIFVAAACVGVLFLFWKMYFAMRRRQKAEACQGCPEYGIESICTGCRVQAEAIRAYETEATHFLLASYQQPTESTPSLSIQMGIAKRVPDTSH